MKINFEDSSYIEVTKSPSPGKVMITIMAKSEQDSLKTIANSVELDMEEFNKLIQLDNK